MIIRSHKTRPHHFAIQYFPFFTILLIRINE